LLWISADVLALALTRDGTPIVAEVVKNEGWRREGKLKKILAKVPFPLPFLF
jgi:hypothetical protein